MVMHDDFRCVLIDDFDPQRPRSLPPRATTVDEAVGDLFVVADHYGDKSFSLYGSSVGGALGLAAMRAAPERIERAALQGAFAHRQLSGTERLLIKAAGWWPGRLKNLPLRKNVQLQNHQRWFPPFDGSRWAFLSENTGNVPLRVLARRAHLAAQIDLRDELAKIHCPTLVIHTEGEGQLAAQCQLELIAGLPNCQSAWIEHTGQLPYLTHPHRLAKLLKPFFQGEPLPEMDPVPPWLVEVDPMLTTTE